MHTTRGSSTDFYILYDNRVYWVVSAFYTWKDDENLNLMCRVRMETGRLHSTLKLWKIGKFFRVEKQHSKLIIIKIVKDVVLGRYLSLKGREWKYKGLACHSRRIDRISGKSPIDSVRVVKNREVKQREKDSRQTPRTYSNVTGTREPFIHYSVIRITLSTEFTRFTLSTENKPSTRKKRILD